MLKTSFKKKFSKTIAVLLGFGLMLSLLIGCSNEPATSQQTPADSKTRIVTDMAGRQVEIPTTVNTVYCAVPTAEAMMYTLAPEKMAAWVNAPSEDMKKFLSERAQNLPVLGGWMGEKCTANLEEIAKLSPDLIVFMTDLETDNMEYATKNAQSITDQTKRPVVVLDSLFTETVEAYRMMGDFIGAQERAEQLAGYSEQKMKEVSDMVAKIPEDKRVAVYYAEGTNGLATEPEASHHTDVLKFVRGRNVADVEARSGQGMSPVSMEQVLAWNPEVVLVSSSTGGQNNYQSIMTDVSWSKVKAVKDGKVYITPLLPFGWFDRPPNIMRVLGIQWCASVLYPEYADIDLNNETKEFFEVFINYDITDEQINELLKDAVPK